MIQLTEKEYNDLKKDQLLLQALRNGGVDNRDWYDLVIKEYEKLCKEAGIES